MDGLAQQGQLGSAGQTQPAGGLCLARCLFPPEEMGNSCSGSTRSGNSPASLPAPVQSPTQRATSCCSSEEGARCRCMSSCTSPWVGSDLLLPFQDSSREWDAPDWGAAAQIPRSGHHKLAPKNSFAVSHRVSQREDIIQP